MTEDEIKRLTEAFGRLTGDTDDLSEQLKKNLAQQDVYTVAVKKSNDAIDQEILDRLKLDASLVRGQQVYEQQMRALGLAKNALGEFERTTVTITAQQKKRLAEEEVISNKVKSRDELSAKYHSIMADKTGSLIKGLQVFGDGLNKTIFDSSKGSSKYGEVLDDAGGKVQALGLLFGPFGKVIAFTTGALMKMAGAALKQQEKLNDVYEKLSEFGAVDVTGIAGMFRNLQNMGFTVSQLDKFGDVLKNAGPNLATIGTTAAEGAKRFAETMGQVKNSGAERQLRMLGFTSESMAKTFIDYQGMMARTGMVQEKDSKKIAIQSVEYAKTLDQLSKLTGQTRDEMQKRADADANDLKYRLQLQDIQKQDPEIYKKVRDTTLLAGEMGEETVSGLREMIAGGGQIIGDASAKLSLATNGAAESITQDLLEGKITAVEANQKLAKAINATVESYRGQFKYSNEISAALGISAKQIDGANKLQEKGQEELEQIIKDQHLQMKGSADNERAAEVQRQISERNAQQAKDALTHLIGKRIVPAMEMFFKVIDKMGGALATFVKFISFGKIDFTDLFTGTEFAPEKESPEIQKIRDQQQKLLNERNKLNEQINDKSKLIFDETLKQLNLDEEKLKDARNRVLFEKEYSKNKKIYLDRRTEIDRELEKTDKDVAKIERDKVAAALKRGNAPISPPAEAAASQGADNKSSKKPQEFYDKLYATLLEEAKKQNVANPEAIARLGAAQSSIETGYGKSLAGGSNYFGIKSSKSNKGDAVSTQEWDPVQGKMVTIKDSFRKYESMEESAADYIKFLQENKRYKNVLAAKSTEEAIAEQGKTGYATDPNYVSKLAAVHSQRSRSEPKTMAEGSTVPKAQTGGLFSGPEGGYPVLLHGTELIIPMPNAGDLATALSSVTKTPLNEAAQATSAPSSTTVTGMDQFIALQTDLMNMIATKLDALESRMAKGNDIQENILTYSMG